VPGTVHIMAAMAEHEAGAIPARTKAALAAAKARGTRLGGYRWAIQTVASKGNVLSAKAHGERASKRAKDLVPVIEAIRAGGQRRCARLRRLLMKRRFQRRTVRCGDDLGV
jgi:DNA invertase Pin-like site-specific DNA recombinase